MLRSPDGTHVLTVEAGNLVLDGRPLTSDAEPPELAYATTPDTGTMPIQTRRSDVPPTPVARWSPDGRRLLTYRVDQRAVRQLELIESAPGNAPPGPRVWRYRVPFPGDPSVGVIQLLVVDVEGRTIASVGRPLRAHYVSPLEQDWAWWSDDGQTVWWLRESRGARRLELLAAQAPGWRERVVLEESDQHGYVQPSELLPWRSQARTLGNDELLWLAERADGWSHLYLHDARTGALIRAVTRGSWMVRDVLHVDRTGRWAIVTGCGREQGRDPYLRHAYRISLADGSIELLTPEDADHEVSVSPSGRWLVDTSSRVDTTPVTRLRSSEGTLVLELERADLFKLRELGWRPPERFQATAADGATTLYGALFLPSGLDPSSERSRRLPVVDDLYPGPQLIRTPKAFRVDGELPDGWPGMWGPTATAELGVAVVCLDGRGTPLRGRDFRRQSYGRLHEAGELADHVAVLRQLARERPYLDLERVAAIGHSSGGFAAARALLAYPDSFHVGVAASGVHDLRSYLAYWGEKYQSLDQSLLACADNARLAERLRGPLLLIHGELDDNVHPTATLRLLSALLAAGKRADLVLLPGEGHACMWHPEYQRAMWEHLLRHLAP
jgi:dipeptidyl-peptidase-4